MKHISFSWLHDPTLALWYAGAAVLLLSACVVLGRAAVRAGERAEMMRLRSEAAEAYAASPWTVPPGPFDFRAGELADLGEAMSAGGAVLDEVAGEPPEPRQVGEILKWKVAGRGTFPQLLSLFDIIHMKKHWVRADLLRLSREGDRLSFEMELAAYRSRGTYEEEKHRTDRSDGNGEEPRRTHPR